MKKRGFTLLELILVLFISSILILLINNLIFVNFKLSNRSFHQEMDYKNSTNCMLYIENLIRSSKEIEENNSKSNFILYVQNEESLSTYRFEQNGNNLYAYIRNTDSRKNREVAVPIGICKNSNIVYDKKRQGFDISIDFIEEESTSFYKTFIGKTYEK
ncbi:prepilin-type N-terminal cleavage/methylation domain-containing protein [Anaerococcus porci]|uniref:Prepilin-type N-terminal cleavage/methylation domain-containing protein n=1 Tax=Anaerococcus porci TaxID=2652269 RepID=A0A6N7VCJ1_9FIRM|nr:prepilin-type N-terminal cleavage/methylation domain-containing protein [Anaerococcus porci]MDY3006194.1 prepilin-type N-terminal cleavage/methylation domain-containing protein [Anaerococcus porci]MSS77168.1 prepilin-type N-terminal cleavage/methylation domain-containing protein [Anaerococcus porci]